MDCCQVAAKVIESYTGQDYSIDLPYSNEEGAAEILEDHGGLSGLFTHLFGDSIQSGYEIGDPVLVRIADVELMGIFMGDFVACKTTRGMLNMHTHHIVEGWHIG
jgi:hypothetical protein